jgi:hypothetical protein
MPSTVPLFCFMGVSCVWRGARLYRVSHLLLVPCRSCLGLTIGRPFLTLWWTTYYLVVDIELVLQRLGLRLDLPLVQIRESLFQFTRAETGDIVAQEGIFPRTLQALANILEIFLKLVGTGHVSLAVFVPRSTHDRVGNALV